MAEIVDISITDLLFDTKNARLRDEQTSQQAALLAIVEAQGKQSIKLATDVVENGIDPTNLLGVVATTDQRKRYIVYEGNRRTSALKALETPSSVMSVMDNSDKKKLQHLAVRFAQSPISSVKCTLFASEKELTHWIELRHTGQHDGAGLVQWGADEKDRFAARHGHRSPAGQILDFVENYGMLSEAANRATTEVITNLGRLVSTPKVRERLGIQIVGGQVLMLYPTAEVAKSLTRIVEDLKTKKIKVADLYHEKDRLVYAQSIPSAELPDPSTALSDPALLGSTETPKNNGAVPTVPPKRKRQTGRTTLIPKTCQLNIAPPRINGIYVELSQLSADQLPNACSVELRVFLELSVQHYIVENNLLSHMTERERDYTKLATRLKEVVKDLKQKNKINSQLEIAINKVADSKFVIAAGVTNFNLYVHNEYVFPKATELKSAWDELQPFMEKLWP